MAQTLEELVVELRADVGSLRRELRVAENTVATSSRKMEKEAGGIAGGFAKGATAVKAFGAAVAALGVGAVVGTLTRLTREAIEQAGELSDLAEQVGITAERYQELRFAVRNTGGDVGALQAGFATFARNLGQLEVGTGSLLAFLEKADPAFAETLKGASSNAEAFDLLADRVAALASRNDQLALSQAALGRGGREFVNLLSQGSAGVAELSAQARELGAVIDDDTIARGDKLADAFGNIAEVLRARFTEAVIGARSSGGDLLDTLTDPQTIREVGDLAEGVGNLAGALVRLAAAAGRVLGRFSRLAGELREGAAAAGDFARFDAAIADAERRKAATADLPPLGPGVSVEISADERAAFFRGAGIAPPAGRTFSPTFTPPGDDDDADKSKGRDPLETALQTIRAELQAAERLADERKRFEEEVTRDLEQETLTREQLVERWVERRIDELERLGLAEEQAAELRAAIEQTGEERLADIRAEGFERLGQIAELGMQTVGDFIAGALLEESEQGFDDLVASFAKTLLRMQLTAAASGIGEILKEQITGAVSSAGSSSGGGGGGFGSFFGSILGRVARFADGGVVTGPTLGLIGEDVGTRPELVMPLDRFRELRSEGAEISVVNAAPEVRASARRVRGRSGRSAFELQLESTFLSLMQRGAFREQLGGRHAPGMR